MIDSICNVQLMVLKNAYYLSYIRDFITTVITYNYYICESLVLHVVISLQDATSRDKSALFCIIVKCSIRLKLCQVNDFSLNFSIYLQHFSINGLNIH